MAPSIASSTDVHYALMCARSVWNFRVTSSGLTHVSSRPFFEQWMGEQGRFTSISCKFCCKYQAEHSYSKFGNSLKLPHTTYLMASLPSTEQVCTACATNWCYKHVMYTKMCTAFKFCTLDNQIRGCYCDRAAHHQLSPSPQVKPRLERHR